ncbi:MAG: hypothetical protein KDA28_15715 [Phycisphaerales bacterium]|nr:hypothetical protein [Phycisphaerales bacterium]
MIPDEHTEDHGGEPLDHESIAQDRFVHGLLEFLHRDTDASREVRIAEVMTRISTPLDPPHRHRRRLAKVVPLATTALMTFIVVGALIIFPQPSAQAMVESAIRATREASALRYEIRILDHLSSEGGDRAVGSLEMQGERMLVHLDSPDGSTFVMGRDDEGTWSLRRDGTVERLAPRAAAPRWITVGENAILIGSLQELLEQLGDDDYDIEQVDGETTRLVATRRPGRPAPVPDRISIWIDDETSLVDTLVLHWDRPGRGGPPRRSEPSEDSGAPDRRPPPPPRDGAASGERDGADRDVDRPREHRPPPPERITFQRVDPVARTAEEFSPPGR